MPNNDFQIILQALLDTATSESNINTDIDTLQKKIKNIQIKAQLGSMDSITEQIAKIVNQKISISNIDINQGQINKSMQQAVNEIHSSWSKTLSGMKHDINSIVKSLDNEKNKLSSYNLTKLFNLDRGKIDGSVIQQVRSLTKELNSLAKEAVKTSSDSAWEGITTKINSLSQVLTRFGSSRDLAPFKESLDILNYFQNKKIFAGNKAEVLSNTGMNVKELNNQFRNLGITFTTVSGNATKLDTVWSELCNISPNLQQFSSFGDQINAVVEHLKTAKEVLQSDRYLQPLNGNEVSSELVRWMTNIEGLAKRASILKEEYSELEKTAKTSSASSADTVVQNEEKKQQAYRETTQIQKQIAEGESLIKSGANVVTFEHTNNAAREAATVFKELLKDENAVISVSERFGKSNGLTSFTVNVKRAAGEVESLRYALEPLKDMNGNLTGEFKFINKGAALNNASAIRQTQAVENAFSQYTAKLEQFKSTNNNILSGLSAPLDDFENKLSSLRNGTVTINELKNSFRMLKAESSKITSNLSGDLNKIDKAVRNIANGKETISGLRAEFKGLSNTPKEINSELNSLATGLQNIKKIENQEGRTANWSKAYHEWDQVVDSLRAKLRVLIKEQANAASTQIFKTSDLRKANIPYMTKVSNTTEKQMAEIQKMAHAHGWQSFDVKGVEQADGLIKKLTLTVTDAEGALKKLNFQREKLQGNGKAQFGLMQTSDIQVLKTASQAQEELAQKAAHANEKLDEQRTKLANKIQLSLDTSGYESKVETLISRTRQWTDEQGNARISTEALSKAFQDLNAAHDALAKNNTAANQQALINAEKELDIQIKKVTNSARTMNAQLAKDSTISSLHNQIQEFYDKNSAAHSKWGTRLKQMLAETASGAKLTHERVQQISTDFTNVGIAARQAGRLGKSFTQTLKEGMRSFSYWTSSTFLVMKMIQSIKKAVSTVKELDTALVDLKKTTTMTASQLEEFYYNANDVAKQMGVTTNKIITQAAAWSRLGWGKSQDLLYGNI